MGCSWRSLACALGVAAGLVVPGAAQAAPTELFFSEYIEGSSNNKALEIYNGTGAPVVLTGAYDVQMCFNGAPTCSLTIPLTGTVAPGDVFVLAQASANATVLAQADQTNGSGWFNGDDAVILRKGTTVVDSIGQAGFDPGTEWGTGLTSTADNTLRRKAGVEAGDTATGNAFDPAVEWDGFANDTFDGLGAHAFAPPTNAPVAAACGSGIATLEGAAVSKTVTATDPDGRVTGFTIAVSPAPSSGSISITSQTPAAAAGGTASATIGASADLAPGSYTVNVTGANNDAPPQSGTCSFTVNVTEILPIGLVQGAVTNGATAPVHRSPFAPPSGNGSSATFVAIEGVIYEKTLSRTSAGASNYGFFIQNTAAQADGDPATSDGIWVFMSTFTTLVGGYEPKVGDSVVLSGRVAEFFSFTQLTSARLERLVASAVNVDAALPPMDANPSADLTQANLFWERHEGMRLRVPASSLVTDGLDVFPSTADAEMWIVRHDSPISGRTGYARRVFRDAHPLDDQPGLVDNGNGYRILVGALGLKALAGDNTLLLPPSRTFATVTNALVGGLNFSFNKYRIETELTPALANGIDPALNAPPTPTRRLVEYSVGDYNVENLYDYRDDPFDGCDFTGNSGCPGVNPPFDYVPASDAVYQERLGLIADQIAGDLHAPDIVLVQEAEDQDICSVGGGALVCGATNNADGKPDTLQELALRIEQRHGIKYDAGYDRDGSDARGIVAALLYRTDRVQLLPARADDPVLGSTPDFTYRSGANPYNSDVQNPKALNAPLPADVTGSTDGNQVYTRDPQVGLFRIWRLGVGVGGFVDVYAISNHFSSTPDQRVNQRREQAAYLAEIVAATGSPRVVAGGDFNVFPRPDDPLNPPSDQLGPLYAKGLWNLWDTLVVEAPAAAYSYVFLGQAQTLDGQFVTPTLKAELAETRVAHVNADFPADYAGDGARGLSDHDPMASRFELGVTIERLQALLAYYCETGAITSRGTCSKFQRLLDRVAVYVARGRTEHVREALAEFLEELKDTSRAYVPSAVAASLAGEALLLRAAFAR